MKQMQRMAILAAVLLSPAMAWGQAGWLKHTLDSSVAGAYSARIADLNNDGRPDIVGCGFFDSTLFWFENTGAGGFVKHPVAAGYNALIAVPADVNGDGSIDIVASAWGQNRISWWQNSGAGSFTEHVVSDSFDLANGVDAVDLDGDGHRDLLGTSFAAKGVRWWRNDGSQHFTEHLIVNRDSSEIAVATDINKDGHLDVLATSWTASGGISVCTNDGAMHFSEQFLPFPWAHWVAAADLDGDGNTDIVGAATSFTSSASGEIAWWQNDGSGGFTKHIIAANFGGADHVVITDLNGDGKPDIAATAWNTGTVCWFENHGAGEFTRHDVTSALAGAIGLDAGDLDRDSDQDIIAAGYDANRMEWYTNVANLVPTVALPHQGCAPGGAADFVLTLPGGSSGHGPVSFAAALAPASGAIECHFIPASIPPAGACTLRVAAAAGAPLGQYTIAIQTADSADTLPAAAVVKLDLLGSGQALCVGCSGPLLSLVRLAIPQADDVNRLPPQVGGNYRYLVMADSGRPSDSAAVRAFIQQGGNVLLTGRAPADLAGGNTLAGIAGWLGAQTHALYSGSGMKVISTYGAPFGVSAIAVGDTLGAATNGYSRLSGIGAGAVLVARYGTSNSIIGGLFNEYGTGRCLWVTGGAGFSVKHDQLIRGFLSHPALGVSGAVPAMVPPCPGLRLAVFPNPAVGRLGIGYQLPAASRVAVRLYDVCGRLVRILDQGWKDSGPHQITSAGHDDLAAGVYFVRIDANGASVVRKAVVLR